MTPWFQQVLVPVLSAIFAAGGAYAAVKVQLKMVEHSAQRAHTRIDEHLRDHITGAI